MAHFDSIDLRTDKRKWFICTISLCGRFGDESVRVHGDMQSAENSLEWINRVGCGSYCTRSHCLAEIPRGHIRNIKNRPHFKSCGYLRWLVENRLIKVCIAD
jgi:hypothetical protein